MKNVTLLVLTALAAGMAGCRGERRLDIDPVDGGDGTAGTSAAGSGGGGSVASGGRGGAQGATGPAGASGTAGATGAGGAGAVGTAGASGTAGAAGAGGTSGVSGGAGAGGAQPRDAGAAPDALPRLELNDAGLPVASMPAEDACLRYATAYCAQRKACQPSTFSIAFADDASCQRALERSCRLGLAYPGLNDSATRVASCATAVQALDCTGFNSDTPPTSCMAPPGMLTENTPCNVSGQCQPGSFCRYELTMMGTTTMVSTCGKCTRRVPEGQPCDGASQLICAEGLACLYTGSSQTGTCVRLLKSGEACTGRDICEFPTSCVRNACTPVYVGKEGEVCRAPGVIRDCDVRTDLYCNRITDRCERQPAAAPAGQPCGSRTDGSGAFVSCDPNATCTGVAGMGFINICLARSDVGGPCTTAVVGQRCKAGLLCRNELCEAPPVSTTPVLGPVVCR